jgi:transcription termination factor Rho
MSVEPSTLERSALERKDREELTTIAQALGAKPPSRARKAEIVQLILELTGVEPSGGSDAGGARSGTRGKAGKQATEAAGPSADTGDTSDADDGSDAGAPTEVGISDAGSGDAAAGAGDSAAGSGTTRNGRSKEATVTDDGDTGSPASAASDGGASSAGGAVGASDAPGDDEPPSEWELEFGGTTDVPDPPVAAATGAGRSRSGGAKGAGSKGNGSPANGAAGGSARSRAGQGNGTATDDGSAGGGGQSGGDSGGAEAGSGTAKAGDGAADGQAKGESVDVSEPGNRRRRRRGRRGKDDQTHTEEFSGEPVEVDGLLDLRDEGYGFLRVRGYLPSKDDIYVSVKQVRQFGLRKGDHVRGASRPAMRNEKNPALLRIDKVNGVDPEQARQRRRFEDLTPLFPDEKLALEVPNDPSNMTARIVDLIAPIGKGQRGLIVSPPKAGKTAIVKQVARSMETNNPEVKLMVLLVDERPEEVTDMRRWLRSETSEVIASTFDRPAEEHTQVSELTIERAKRLVEDGQDVCIILDGITRLARAYNLAAPATGRIMSGGVDSGALYPPKKFFGAARNIEEGGSLTILATALIETGSKMDEVIFEEFKGTGNMELRLDRRLAERRIYPAIDVDASSTRHEELLFARNELNLAWALRRVLSGLSSTDGGNAAALELLIDRMKTFRTNDEFLAEVAKNRLAAG